VSLGLTNNISSAKHSNGQLRRPLLTASQTSVDSARISHSISLQQTKEVHWQSQLPTAAAMTVVAPAPSADGAVPLAMALPQGGPHVGPIAAAAIAAMGVAVQNGDFPAAEAIGAAAPVNLAWPKHALQNFRPLSDGTQAAVFVADVAPAWAHLVPDLQQGQDEQVAVAVKRAHIRNSLGAAAKRIVGVIRQHCFPVPVMGPCLVDPACRSASSLL
jgi:hypothetical protein